MADRRRDAGRRSAWPERRSKRHRAWSKRHGRQPARRQSSVMSRKALAAARPDRPRRLRRREADDGQSPAPSRRRSDRRSRPPSPPRSPIPARATHRATDARRHPAEIDRLHRGCRPGDRVLDLIPGDGYWTRIFSRIVGPGGPGLCGLAEATMPTSRRAMSARCTSSPRTPDYANVRVDGAADRRPRPRPSRSTSSGPRRIITIIRTSSWAMIDPGPAQPRGLRDAEAGRHLVHHRSCRRARDRA